MNTVATNMTTINMTREGLSSFRLLCSRNANIRRLLNTQSCHTDNFEWDFDSSKHRNVYRVHLPNEVLNILLFLFQGEYFHNVTKEFWNFNIDYTTQRSAKKMLKRILKQTNSYKS